MSRLHPAGYHYQAPPAAPCSFHFPLQATVTAALLIFLVQALALALYL